MCDADGCNCEVLDAVLDLLRSGSWCWVSGCAGICMLLSCGFFFSSETFILKVSFEVLDLQ